MGFKGKRIQIVVNGDKQHRKWKEFAKNNGYGSVSQLARTVVEQNIKNVEDPDKARNQNNHELNGIFKLLNEMYSRIEIMDSRSAQNNGEDSEVVKIAKKILLILSKGKKALSEIDGMLNHHDHDTVVKAIVLVYDLGLVGIKTENKNHEYEV